MDVCFNLLWVLAACDISAEKSANSINNAKRYLAFEQCVWVWHLSLW